MDHGIEPCDKIKVHRIGLVKLVQTDSALIKAIGRKLKLLPRMRASYKRSNRVVDKAISAQSDFRREPDNSRRIRANFRDHDYIRFPIPFNQYCGEGVLPMECMNDLVTISDLPAAKIDTERAVISALHALFKMIFIDGFVHADLHADNLFFRQDDEIVILDLGLVVEIDSEDGLNLVKLFIGIVTNNGDLCACIVMKTAAPAAAGRIRPRGFSSCNGRCALQERGSS